MSIQIGIKGKIHILVRIGLFVCLPVFLGAALLGSLEEDASLDATNACRSQMRAILDRVARMGNPEKRFADTLDRLSAVPLPTKVLASRAARLVRKERGALDLFLFDASGTLVPLPGLPAPPKAASQAFLKGLRKLPPAPHPKLIAAFAGKAEALEQLAPSPGVLINLQNGDRKSFCGWWTVKGPQRKVNGWIIAFVNRGNVDPDRLMDRSVSEVRNLVGRDFQIGWRHPSATATVRPPLPDLPESLPSFLSSTAPGVEASTFQGRHLVTSCSDEGELLFCLSRALPGSASSFAGMRTILLSGGILAVVLMLLFNHPRFPVVFGIRGKLVLLLLTSGGILLGGFFATVLADRGNRERQIVRTFQAEHITLLEKMDRSSASEQFRFARVYEELAQISRGAPASRLREQIPSLSAFVSRNLHTFNGIVLVDDQGAVLFQLTNIGEKAFMAKLAVAALNNLNADEVSDPSKQGDGSMMTTALGISLAWNYRMNGSVTRQRVFDQDVLSYIIPIEGQNGRFQALLLAIHDTRMLEAAALKRIQRRMGNLGRERLRWAALPISPDARWKTFPKQIASRDPLLRKVRDQVVATQLPAHEIGFIHGREYLVSGLHGRGLDGYVLMMARPYDEIEHRTFRLNLQVGGISLLLLGLVLGGAFLGAKALLTPLHELSKGLAALADRRFSTRIEPCGVAELSLVIQRFNMVMENLGDLKLARTVQEHLWPREGLSGAGWSIAGRCCTADGIGGDHHEWFLLPDGRLVFGIGDVAGHGISAALVTAAAKVELAHGASRTTRPSEILNRMNEGFLEQVGRSRPMTFWLAVFDPETRRLCFSDAGHPFGLVFPSTGECVEAGAIGLPLGSKKKTTYADHELDLSAGGRLVLFSDGLIEAENPATEPFGYGRFRELAGSFRHVSVSLLLDGIFAGVTAWSKRDLPQDDQTLVVLTVDPPCSTTSREVNG